MTISELIDKLEEAKLTHGDAECLIEVDMPDDGVCLLPVEELSYEERDGYGPSITLLC